jgi:hypothetical protein
MVGIEGDEEEVVVGVEEDVEDTRLKLIEADVEVE